MKQKPGIKPLSAIYLTVNKTIQSWKWFKKNYFFRCNVVAIWQGSIFWTIDMFYIITHPISCMRFPHSIFEVITLISIEIYWFLEFQKWNIIRKMQACMWQLSFTLQFLHISLCEFANCVLSVLKYVLFIKSLCWFLK